MSKVWKLFLYNEEQDNDSHNHIPIQHSIKILAKAIRKNKVKDNQIRSKFLWFADGVILYVENPTNSTKIVRIIQQI